MQPLKNNKYRIFKSRYDSIDSYLSSCGEKYNDIDLTIDEEIKKQLLGAGKVIWRIISQMKLRKLYVKNMQKYYYSRAVVK